MLQLSQFNKRRNVFINSSRSSYSTCNETIANSFIFKAVNVTLIGVNQGKSLNRLPIAVSSDAQLVTDRLSIGQGTWFWFVIRVCQHLCKSRHAHAVTSLCRLAVTNYDLRRPLLTDTVRDRHEHMQPRPTQAQSKKQQLHNIIRSCI